MRYRYRSDDELKDSGVEWIGKIPKDWETLKLKRITQSVKNGIWGDDEQHNSDDIPCIRILNFDRNKIQVNIDDLTVRNIPKEKQKDYLLNKGDLLIEKSGGGEKNPVGFVAIYNHILPAVYANFMAKISLNDKADSGYVRYLCSNIYNKRIHMDSVNQTTGIQNLDTERYFSRVIAIPHIKEQKKIANFLDEKSSQFDLIISKKEKLIERLEEAKKSLISEVVTGKVKVVKIDDGYELIKRSSEEMKDSGVEWLGEIPKNWEVKRIKQISSVISKGTTPSTVGKEIIDKGEIRFLKAENIYEGKISLTPEFFIDEETNKILKRSELKENDILFVIAGATIGKVAIVQKEHCPANTNQAISFIRLYNDVNYKFVYYWLNSPKLQENMWLYAVQSAQPNLSMENLGNFYITYPCNYEIDILTDYIEKKDIEINDIIKNIKYQIEKLKEAKQSLISEAVTGKIEILD